MGQKVPASRVGVKGGVIAGASVKQGGRGNLGDGKTCDSPRAHDGANGLCDQRGRIAGRIILKMCPSSR